MVVWRDCNIDSVLNEVMKNYPWHFKRSFLNSGSGSMRSSLKYIGHFRVPEPHNFKVRLVQKSFRENEFYLRENKKSFPYQCFPISLTLKQRLEVTQK